MLQKSVTDTPVREEKGVRFSNRLFIRDLVLTLLAAVFTGLSGSILLILLVFGWGHATADGQLQQQAPVLKSDVQIDITGLLARVGVAQLFREQVSSPVTGILASASSREPGIATGDLLSV